MPVGDAEGHSSGTVPLRMAGTSSDARDARVLKTVVLRSIPSISSAVSQLLAKYDHQMDREVLQGKSNVIRKKSGRYNMTDTTTLGSQFRWPNEGLVSASHLRKPSYDDLSLTQWASGQLANILLVDDQNVVRHMC